MNKYEHFLKEVEYNYNGINAGATGHLYNNNSGGQFAAGITAGDQTLGVQGGVEGLDTDLALAGASMLGIAATMGAFMYRRIKELTTRFTRCSSLPDAKSKANCKKQIAMIYLNNVKQMQANCQKLGNPDKIASCKAKTQKEIMKLQNKVNKFGQRA